MAELAAKHLFHGAFKSAQGSGSGIAEAVSNAAHRATSSRGPRSEGAGALGSDANAPLHGFCSCFQRVIQVVGDLTGSTTPEEKRRREFDRSLLPILQDGALFAMVEYERPQSANLVSQVSRSVTSFLGGTARAAAGQSATSSTTATDAVGCSVMLALDVQDGLALVWRSLELEQNRPKFSGRVELHLINAAASVDSASEGPLLVLRGRAGKVLLSVKGESGSQCSEWAKAISEALVVLAPQLEGSASESRGLMDRQQRFVELERRKREREKRKAALGSVGMTYTAQAMIGRSDA